MPTTAENPTNARLEPQRAAALRRVLLAWYRAHRRDYPWRRSTDSYRVWVSEVMLQQTRIQVVLPAFDRFMAAFPALQDLAHAELDEVLSLWSGLGYYSRARSLHAAARRLVDMGVDEFPRSYTEARKLPGVGRYTAAAVTSIAYGEPHAAVDGNIVRVLSRLQCLPAPDSRGEPYQSLADQLIDRSAPGEWNQALMELGQFVCTPSSPRCGECPARRRCLAFQTDAVDRFPQRKPRRARESMTLYAVVTRDSKSRMLLERGAFTYLPHLWLPPLQFTPPRGRSVATFKHAILHRDFEVHVVERIVPARRLPTMARSTKGVERRCFELDALDSIGRSSLLTKTLTALRSVPSS